jgi:hypothetical protein
VLYHNEKSDNDEILTTLITKVYQVDIDNEISMTLIVTENHEDTDGENDSDQGKTSDLHLAGKKN